MPRITQPDTQVNTTSGESGHNGAPTAARRQPGTGPGKGCKGAGPGNMNRLKHGKKLNRSRLVVGELPNTMIAIKREGRHYRRVLEAEILAVKGEINLLDAHLVDTAAAGTIAAGISRWLLRNRIKEMSVSDIRQCGMDNLKAKTQRDKAVMALGLDIKPEPLDLKDYILESGNGKSKVSDLNSRVVNNGKPR